MKYIYTLILLMSITFANINYLTPAEINTLSKSSKVLSNTFTRIIEGIDEGDSYFLDLQDRGKNVNCFIDKKTGLIYKGNRFDINGTKSVFPKSPQRIAAFKKTIEEGISFSYGSGKKNLYVFTDPECPYCQKFERQVQGKLKDYTVHVILYPLKFHKKAPAMTAWILEAKTDALKHKRMNEIMVSGSQVYKKYMGKKYTPQVSAILQKGAKAVRLLGVRGTPSVFNENFKKINWSALIRNTRKKQ